MLQIRFGSYETNSSSVHTFYVAKEFKPRPFRKPQVLHAELASWDRQPLLFKNSDFISYIWSVLCDFDFDIEWDNKTRYTRRVLAKRNEYVERIEKLLAPFNVTVEWEPLRDTSFFWVDHGDDFIPILDELLARPELLLSALLCRGSHFYTGNNEQLNANDELPALDSYWQFIRGS